MQYTTMFLSTLNSRCEDDSLIVDLTPEDGPLLRFSCFGDGMKWYRNDGDAWVETAFDLGVRLVNAAHAHRRNLPVNRYLEHWPAELLTMIEPMWHAQASIMQLCARYAAARDLARSNPVLLWLAAARCAECAEFRERLPGLLACKQDVVLGAVLGRKGATAAQVNFLRKLVVMSGDQSTLRWIRCAVDRESLVRRFCHWRRLPTALLCYTRGPLLKRMHWLRERLADTSDVWLIEWMLAGDGAFLRDTHVLVREVRRVDAPAVVRLVNQLKPGWEGVRRLHDELLRIFSIHYAYCPEQLDIDAEHVFAAPPMPSSALFEAITSVSALWEEAKIMRHCVFLRAPEVIAGKSYIYRVHAPRQRATLELRVLPDGKFAIEELRGADNDPPDPSTVSLIGEWLGKGAVLAF